MKPGTLLAVATMKHFGLVEEKVAELEGGGVDCTGINEALDAFREEVFSVGEKLPGFDPMMECLSSGEC